MENALKKAQLCKTENGGHLRDANLSHLDFKKSPNIIFYYFVKKKN